jgi:ectoine hydroxylase-related dioxygenase (phytanoyl-CoA dioxygenase family)
MSRPITRSITKNMTENYDCIHKNGYHIYKNICDVDNDVGLMDHLNKQVDSKYGGPIFNGEKNDKKRIQSTLHCNKTIISEFIETLEENIYNLLPSDSRLYFSNWVILKSLDGCNEQRPHTDYNVENIKNITDPICVPLLVLVALMPETYLDIWDSVGVHKKLVMEKGDVLIFRADMIHAGSSYEKENIRIHAYLDSPMVKRIPNRTWFAG